MLNSGRLFCISILLFTFSLFVLSSCGGGGSGVSGNEDISGTITSVGIFVAVDTTNRHSLSYAFRDIELINEALAEDPAGVPLEGATVELIFSDGTIVVTTTDENGKFAFDDVPAGTYSIRVSEPSIETMVIDNIVVLEGDKTVIRGIVTADGAVVTVDVVVDDCIVEAGNAAQLVHAQNLADAAEVPVEEVLELREVGCLGWGVVAKELGVQPGILGLGNSSVKGGGMAAHVENSDSDDDDQPGKGKGNGKPDKSDNPGKGHNK